MITPLSTQSSVGSSAPPEGSFILGLPKVFGVEDATLFWTFIGGLFAVLGFIIVVALPFFLNWLANRTARKRAWRRIAYELRPLVDFFQGALSERRIQRTGSDGSVWVHIDDYSFHGGAESLAYRKRLLAFPRPFDVIIEQSASLAPAAAKKLTTLVEELRSAVVENGFDKGHMATVIEYLELFIRPVDGDKSWLDPVKSKSNGGRS